MRGFSRLADILDFHEQRAYAVRELAAAMSSLLSEERIHTLVLDVENARERIHSVQ